MGHVSEYSVIRTKLSGLRMEQYDGQQCGVAWVLFLITQTYFKAFLTFQFHFLLLLLCQVVPSLPQASLVWAVPCKCVELAHGQDLADDAPLVFGEIQVRWLDAVSISDGKFQTLTHGDAFPILDNRTNPLTIGFLTLLLQRCIPLLRSVCLLIIWSSSEEAIVHFQLNWLCHLDTCAYCCSINVIFFGGGGVKGAVNLRTYVSPMEEKKLQKKLCNSGYAIWRNRRGIGRKGHTNLW